MQARRGRRAVALGGELPPGAARRAASTAARGAAITLQSLRNAFTIEQKARLALLKNSPAKAKGPRSIRAGPSRTRRRAALHLAQDAWLEVPHGRPMDNMSLSQASRKPYGRVETRAARRALVVAACTDAGF